MQQDPLTNLHFRELNKSDLPKILQLEKDAYDFPWSEKIFHDCLTSNYQCIAVMIAGEFIGYMIISSVLDEAHLLNICLSQQWQGKNLGKNTVLWLMAELLTQKIERLFLEVRPSNLSALALYTKLGFDTIGLRKDYYPSIEGREDAIAMMKTL